MTEQPRPAAARVRDSGLAVVHAGELIVPAAGSEADLEFAASDPRAVVEYHFPVVVEIRQAAPPGIHEMTEHVARRLIQGMWG
jgi:hypothetical protein